MRTLLHAFALACSLLTGCADFYAGAVAGQTGDWGYVKPLQDYGKWKAKGKPLNELQHWPADSLLRLVRVAPTQEDRISFATAAEMRGLLRKGEAPDVILNMVSVGMSKRAVLLSWGPPRDINRSDGPAGYSEQWCYGEFPGTMQFVYFGSTGVVTSWQSSS